MRSLEKILVLVVVMATFPLSLHSQDQCQPPTKDLPTAPEPGAPPRWRINKIFGYSGPQDPKLTGDMEQANTDARAFKEKFQGKIKSKKLSANRLLEAIQTYERIVDTTDLAHDYLYGLNATNLTDTAVTAAYAKVQQQIDEINALTAFFDLELALADSEHIRKLLDTGKLDVYRHFITLVQQQAPYLKPRREEELLRRVDSVFGGMFRVYQKIVSSLRFPFQGPEDPAPKDYLQQDMTRFINDHPDPEVRRRALAAFEEVYQRHRVTFSSLFNEFVTATILKDEKIRGYTTADIHRHLDNEWGQPDARRLINTTATHYGLAQRLWRAKQRALGLEPFKSSDVGAPLLKPSEKLPGVPYNESVQRVLRTFRRFAPAWADILAEKCYGQGCVDALIYPGKQPGGFMMNSTGRALPVILMNATLTEGDSDTLVHENGHWIDHFRQGQHQPRLNMGSGMLRAETASTFAELLMAQDLLATVTNPRDRLRALMRFMDRLTTAIFRENVYAIFEFKVYDFVRSHGAIGAEDLERLWTEAYQPYYGSVVQTSEHFPATWASVHHFYRRFYVYAYTGGNLLGILMYLKLQKDPSYIKKVDEAYAMGRFAPMKYIYKEILGIDLDDPHVWDPAFAYYETLLREIETLVKQASP